MSWWKKLFHVRCLNTDRWPKSCCCQPSCAYRKIKIQYLLCLITASCHNFLFRNWNCLMSCCSDILASYPGFAKKKKNIYIYIKVFKRSIFHKKRFLKGFLTYILIQFPFIFVESCYLFFEIIGRTWSLSPINKYPRKVSLDQAQFFR